MKKIPRPYFYTAVIAFLYMFVVGFEVVYDTGYVGATKKNSTDGCVCHGIHLPSDSVIVRITGPDSLHLGGSAVYTLSMTGGPAVAGGFNVAAGRGTLLQGDTATQLMSGELTHTMPRNFQNDTVRWQFTYTAPLSGTGDTLFSIGNSVNLSGTPVGDEFNFGNDFIVHLIDTTQDVGESEQPVSFRLEQNYPNPFNPVTQLQFAISNLSSLGGSASGGQMVRLRIYDVLGNEIATLINETKPPGLYTVSWDASGFSSGVYIYRLDAGAFHQSKKMLLVR